MATSPNKPEAPEANPALAEALHGIASAFQQTVESLKPKKVSVAGLKVATPFNPTAKTTGRKLLRPTYQNGTKLNPTFLTDAEIELVNRLKPGKFCNGLVRVFERDHGADKEVHIVYDNKSFEQRIALKDQARNFEDLLRQCVQGATD